MINITSFFHVFVVPFITIFFIGMVGAIFAEAIGLERTSNALAKTANVAGVFMFTGMGYVLFRAVTHAY